MKVKTLIWVTLIILAGISWLDMLDIKHFPNDNFKEKIYNLTLFFSFWLRIEYLMEKDKK